MIPTAMAPSYPATPWPLIRRLEALAQRAPMDLTPAQASAWIVNPLTGTRKDFSRLFMTHPPVEERVQQLEEKPVTI